jgi:rod shape-determining protein MreC
MFARFAFTVLLIISFMFNLRPVGGSPPVIMMRSSLQVISYPFELISVKLTDSIKKTSTFLVRAKRMEKENAALKDKIKELEANVSLFESVKSENVSLRSAIGFARTDPYGLKLTPAEVISRGGGGIMLVINKGSNDGVKEGETVINKQGLVGRVGEVSIATSKVDLITDPANVISSVLLRTGTFGVVRCGPRLTMDYISESVSVEVGEMVEVSGASTTYARGVPIGRVSKAEKKVEYLFQKVEIAPAADLSKLDVVFICH